MTYHIYYRQKRNLEHISISLYPISSSKIEPRIEDLHIIISNTLDSKIRSNKISKKQMNTIEPLNRAFTNVFGDNKDKIEEEINEVMSVQSR